MSSGDGEDSGERDVSPDGRVVSSADGASRRGAGDRPDGTRPEDEARRKFREALENKRARQADASGGRAPGGSGKIHSPHGPARSKRTFRRKSG